MKLTGSSTKQSYAPDHTAPFPKNAEQWFIKCFSLPQLILPFSTSTYADIPNLNSTYPSILNLNPIPSVTSSQTSLHQCYHIPFWILKHQYLPCIVTFTCLSCLSKIVRSLRAGTTYFLVSLPEHSAKKLVCMQEVIGYI